MVTRIFREYVWTLKVAGASEDVHDVSSIMQDIAPRKGFKVHGITATVSTSDAAATDDSAAYLNFIKNISEAAHHVSPAADGEITEQKQDGVMVSQGMTFRTGDALRDFRFPFYEKPIAFDANDRLNVELTFNNKDVASAECIFRVFIDVEIA